MSNQTQQQIDALIQFINETEDPESITNTIVASVLAYLSNNCVNLAGLVNALATGLTNETAARQQAVDSISARCVNLEGLINALTIDLTNETAARQQAISNINSLLQGDASDAIESLQEVLAFLAEVTDDKTLSGLLLALRSDIDSNSSGIASLMAWSQSLVVDDLEAGGVEKALSAQQGKMLNDRMSHVLDGIELPQVVSAGKLYYNPGNNRLRYHYRLSHNAQTAYREFEPVVKGLYFDKGTEKFYEFTGSEMVALTVTGGGSPGILHIGKGTFAEAWAQAQQNNDVWCWMLDDEVDNEPIVKPIWHTGNGSFIDAAGSPIFIGGGGDEPGTPTFTQVGQVVTITPSSGSVLHYTINGGAEQTSTSAVEVTINQASMTIVAWCVNINGSSTHVTQTYTASAPAAPVMTVGGNVVTQDMTIPRNSVVTITASDGDLYVKVGNGDYQKASGSSTTITCSGDTTTISAKTKDPQTNVESNPVTRTFSVAKPNAPQFSIDSSDVISGTQLNVTWSGGTLHYIINNGAEQTAETSPLALTINVDTDIEAWVVDANNESSNHVTKSYDIAVPGIKVVASDATTMNLGDSGLTSIPIAAGTNKITIADINTLAGTAYSSFTDHAFASLSFGDNTKIVEFDGCGIRLNSLNEAFRDAVNLTSAVGLVIEPNKWAQYVFKGCTSLVNVEVSGGPTATATQMFSGVHATVVDISGLSLTNGNNYYLQMFGSVKIDKLIVGEGFVLPASTSATPFNNGGYTTNYINKLRVASSTPPSLDGYDWVANLSSAYAMATIEVPSGSLQNYLDDAKWSAYSNIISEYND